MPAKAKKLTVFIYLPFDSIASYVVFFISVQVAWLQLPYSKYGVTIFVPLELKSSTARGRNSVHYLEIIYALKECYPLSLCIII